MNNELTEIVFVLDRSGSMAGFEEDTMGGFNAMIDKWKAKKVPVLVNTVLFDQECIVLHDRVKLEDVGHITSKDYWARGSTALFDAVGSAIRHISKVYRYIREEDVPGHTIFVISTDGYENASRRFTGEETKNLIAAQREKGWEFIFLGADIDAHAVSRDLCMDSQLSFSMPKKAGNYKTFFDVVGCSMDDRNGKIASRLLAEKLCMWRGDGADMEQAQGRKDTRANRQGPRS